MAEHNPTSSLPTSMQPKIKLDLNEPSKEMIARTLGSTQRGDSEGGPSSASQLPKEFRRRQNIQFAALCWCLFLAGWNDGSTGPLLPRIQREYHVCLSNFYDALRTHCLDVVRLDLQLCPSYGCSHALSAVKTSSKIRPTNLIHFLGLFAWCSDQYPDI
jgi:hypothetical protein